MKKVFLKISPRLVFITTPEQSKEGETYFEIAKGEGVFGATGQAIPVSNIQVKNDLIHSITEVEC